MKTSLINILFFKRRYTASSITKYYFLSLTVILSCCHTDLDSLSSEQNEAKNALPALINSQNNDTIKLKKILKKIKRTDNKTLRYPWEKAADSIISFNFNTWDRLSADEKEFFLDHKATLQFQQERLKEAEHTWCELLNIGLIKSSKSTQLKAYEGLCLLANETLAYKELLNYAQAALNLKNDFNFICYAAHANRKLSHYREAITYSSQLLEWLNANEYDSIQYNRAQLMHGAIYYDVANIYFSLDLLEIAKTYFTNVTIEEPMSHESLAAQLNLAAIKKILESPEKSREDLFKLLNEATVTNFKKNIYFQIADSYCKEENYSEAKVYCEKAIADLKNPENEFWAMDFYNLLAIINKELNLTEEAHENAYLAFEIANKGKGKQYFEQLNTAAIFLATSFEERGQLDSAKYFNQLHKTLENKIKMRKADYSLLITEKNILIKDLVTAHEKQLKKQVKQFSKTKKYLALSFLLVLVLLISYFFQLKRKQKKQTQGLLKQLEELKKHLLITNRTNDSLKGNIMIDKVTVEQKMDCKLNETDWKILCLLIDNPITTNYELSEKVCKSIAGIRSSLKKMYAIFNIDDGPRDKRILLIIKVVAIFEAD